MISTFIKVASNSPSYNTINFSWTRSWNFGQPVNPRMVDEVTWHDKLDKLITWCNKRLSNLDSQCLQRVKSKTTNVNQLRIITIHNMNYHLRTTTTTTNHLTYINPSESSPKKHPLFFVFSFLISIGGSVVDGYLQGTKSISHQTGSSEKHRLKKCL